MGNLVVTILENIIYHTYVSKYTLGDNGCGKGQERGIWASGTEVGMRKLLFYVEWLENAS